VRAAAAGVGTRATALWDREKVLEVRKIQSFSGSQTYSRPPTGKTGRGRHMRTAARKSSFATRGEDSQYAGTSTHALTMSPQPHLRTGASMPSSSRVEARAIHPNARSAAAEEEEHREDMQCPVVYVRHPSQSFVHNSPALRARDTHTLWCCHVVCLDRAKRREQESSWQTTNAPTIE